MRIPQKNRVVTALLAMMLTLLVSAPALAESYKISQIRYTNRGDYAACPEVNWNDASGRLQVSQLDCVKWADRVTFDIADLDNPPPAGTEVWLRIRISAGEIKSCRTSEATFLFDPAGARAKFHTAGTEFDRNTCKLTCEDCKAR